MSIANPTMDWSEEGFQSEAEMFQWIQEFKDSKPQDTNPYSKNIPVTQYLKNGARAWGVERTSYTGKWIIQESEGHEVDSLWVKEIESKAHINFDKSETVSQAEFHNYRNK